LCGACTIHLNGVETRSCQTAIDFLDEEDEITTIEGLSEDTSHPVQKAWVKHDVPQCGYCQPGQIMTASAFLTRNSNPKDEDIDNAMKMNICRCGTYPRIKKAVQSASEEIRNG
ncbi:MAG: (2Fe-2S)-binding protein, partial [bacterium TMED6]